MKRSASELDSVAHDAADEAAVVVNPLRTGPRIISILQGKGGVGKTTTTHNLALAAVKAGKRVLLIDTDSQMNLTQEVLRPHMPTDEKRDDFLSFIAEKKLVSLASTVEQLRNRPADFPTLNLKDGLFEAIPGQLFLMIGDMNTSSLDEYIGVAQLVFAFFPTQKDTPNMPGRIIQLAAKQLGNIDYVFIDTNPNLGSLNAYLWWYSDYYLSPCVADSFTVSALHYLAEKIQKWNEQITSLLPDLRTAPWMPMSKEKTKGAQCLGLSLSPLSSSPDAPRYRQLLLENARTLLQPLESSDFLYEFPAGLKDATPLYEAILGLIQPEERPTKRARMEDA